MLYEVHMGEEKKRKCSPRVDYRVISVPKDMLKSAEEIIESRSELGIRSVSEAVKVALRDWILKMKGTA